MVWVRVTQAGKTGNLMNTGVILLGGAALFFLTKKNVENVYWRFKSWKISSFGLSEVKIKIQLEFNNASLIDYRADRVYIVITYMGQELGTVVHRGLILIRKQDLTVIELELRVLTREFLNLVNQGLSDQNDPLICNISGSVHIQGIPALSNKLQISLRPYFNQFHELFESLKQLGQLLKPKNKKT